MRLTKGAGAYTKIEKHTGEEWCLWSKRLAMRMLWYRCEGGCLTDESEDESTGDNLSIGAYLAGQGRHETPCTDEEAQIPRRATAIIEQSIRRHLHQNLGAAISWLIISKAHIVELTYATKRILKPTWYWSPVKCRSCSRPCNRAAA